MLSATIRSLSVSRKFAPFVLRNLASEYSLKPVKRLSKVFKMTEDHSDAPWLMFGDSDSNSTKERKHDNVSKKTQNKTNNKGSNGTKAKQQKLQGTTNKKNADFKKGKDSVQATATGAASPSSAEKDHVMENHSDVTDMNGGVQANTSTIPNSTEDTQQTSDDDFELCPEPETGTKKLEVDGKNGTKNNSEIKADVLSTCTAAPSAVSNNNEQFMDCEETAIIAEFKSSDTSNSSCENQASMTSPRTTADEQSTSEINNSKKKKKKKKKNNNNLDNTEVKQQKTEAKEETEKKSEESLKSAEKSPAATTVAKMKCEEPNSEGQQQMEEETYPDPASNRGEAGVTTTTTASTGDRGEAEVTTTTTTSTGNQSTSSSEKKKWRKPGETRVMNTTHQENNKQSAVSDKRDSYSASVVTNAPMYEEKHSTVHQDQMDSTQAEKEKCPSRASNISSENHGEATNLPSSATETPAVKEEHAETPAVKEKHAVDCSESPEEMTDQTKEDHVPGSGEISTKFQVIEVQEALFSRPASESLALCIGQDFEIKNFNLRKFCEKFGNIKKLRSKGKQIGDVAVLEKDGLCIYFLITKDQSTHKTNAKTFRHALTSLKEHCQNDKVTKLSMPRISLTEDGLDWKQAAGMLRETFQDTALTISVCDDHQQTSPHQSSPEGDKKQAQTGEKRGRQDNNPPHAEATPGGKKQNQASGSNSSSTDRTSGSGSSSRDNRPSAISKPTTKATPVNKRQDERSTHTASSDRRQEKVSTGALPQNRRYGVPFDSRPKQRFPGPGLAYQGFQLRVEQGDLFRCPASDSMAHGVSQDFNMRKGIARTMKETFRGVRSLSAQGPKVGDMAVLPAQGQYIYYLITKETLDVMPTYEALRSSLEAMRKHCLTHRVTNISMPKIGCGRDGLEWDEVALIVEDVFKDTSITITVYERIPAQPEGFELLEVKGDLFSCSQSDSMAHCVSRDLHMGKGIAVAFRDSFGGLQRLRAQGKQVGDVAVLPWEGQYIYYLITKEQHFDKPTYETLQSSLEAMRNHCQENKVTSIAMPQIGCGLDLLDWYDVRHILCAVFRNTGITIKVYYL